MPRYDVPQLKGYGDAIQANNSMANAFSSLGNQSQDYLKMEEQKRQNTFDNQLKTDTFNETKNQNTIANKNADRTFDYGVTRDNIKDNQWSQAFTETKNQNAFEQGYKNKVFDHTVNQDNIKNSQWSQAFTKPDYSTFNGVDAQGNPTLNLINKNDGKVVNTGQQIYNEAKKLPPEQQMYYQDRANEMKQKNIDALQKSLTLHPAYSTLNEADKAKAYEYINTNGKLPEFSFDKGIPFVPFTGGYSLPMSDAVKQQKQQELEKSMKALGL